MGNMGDMHGEQTQSHHMLWGTWGDMGGHAWGIWDHLRFFILLPTVVSALLVYQLHNLQLFGGGHLVTYNFDTMARV